MGDDRRRALLLDAPSDQSWRVETRAGETLRFAFAWLGARRREAEVTVALGEARWTHRFGAPAGWVEGSLAAVDSGPHELRVEVGTDGVATRAVVAWAAPRLVRPTTSASSPTNVLVYLIDTLRADHTSIGGHGRDTTPTLKALAADGVAFERAYSTASTTRPVTASLFSSLYPSQHSAWHGRGLSRDVETIAESFRAGGWSTWAFVTNGHVFADGLGFDQGFDRFQAIRGGRGDNHAHSEEINELLLPHLDAFADEPFFLYVHAVDPHSPYDPPEDVRGAFTDPAYDGSIEPSKTRSRHLRRRRVDPADLTHILNLYDEDILYQDRMLGTLIDHLRGLDLLEKTLIVVLADHGDEFREHGGWEHGKRLYEEQIHVPLVLSTSAPALPKGGRVKTPVSLVDVLPTLLSLWDLPVPSAARGRDLRPLLVQAGGSAELIYAEEWATPFGPRVRSVTDGNWKLIETLGVSEGKRTVRRALYDLEDEGETRDVQAEHPHRFRELTRRLQRIRRELRRAGAPARAPAVRLDPRTCRQLEALGYVLPDTKAGGP